MHYTCRQDFHHNKLNILLYDTVVFEKDMEINKKTNEDYNLYTFDMRNLSKPLTIHHDHVGAVLSVAYSSTGKEFCSGSYDKTVRIWNSTSVRSREV